MQIYLIRHGSTAGNLEHRYVGTTDEELTQDACQELRLARGKFPVPDVVFTSPLRRCVQTAGILFPEASKEVVFDLKECEFGAFEYKNYKELQGNEAYQSWIDSGGTAAFPGGESREEFSKRCCKAFETACFDALRKKYDTAVFVVHGGTIMAVMEQYARPSRDYFDWQVKNGCGFSCEVCFADVNENCEAKEPMHTINPGDGRLYLKQIDFLSCEANEKDRIGVEDLFVMKKDKKLRCGYTTGSCAAAAAKAAVWMLLTGQICKRAEIATPKGILLRLPVVEQHISEENAVCAVRKYGGDDPDATDGALIYAQAEKMKLPLGEGADRNDISGACRDGDGERHAGKMMHKARVSIDGGTGVGRVTKPGLEQPVGAAAINRVPREMIEREVEAVCRNCSYGGGIRITISVPSGVELAKRTFNPHIGIVDGISILGTSGIVVPMSEEALIASIRVEMKQKVENGAQYLLITPGNYGADFIRRKELSGALDAEHSMKCSNYVGETLDMAVSLGAKGILFVAHIGKFIKVSGGIMNTHSAQADCRAELITAQTLRALKKYNSEKALLETSEITALAVQLLAANTTEEAVGILQEKNLLKDVITETLGRIHYHLQKRCQGMLETEVILFSNQYGYLGETEGAQCMMEKVMEQTKNSEKLT